MADRVEFFVKMNRLAPASNPNALLPVRFKPVFYDPNLADEIVGEGDDVDSIASEEEADPSKPNIAHTFFRDPMIDPGTSTSEEKEEDDAEKDFKLGRNMRASHGRIGMRQQKNVHELMNARMKLLQQQREQQVLVDQEIVSDKAAAALVNNLLLQGFHITPPQDTAQPLPFQLPPPTSSSEAEDDTVFPLNVQKEKLIGAIHKELKRVEGQGSDQLQEAST